MKEEQRDCLQELVNVAMGQAGDSLARYLEVFVELSVPRVRIIQIDQLHLELNLLANHATSVSAVRQGFYDACDGNGMRGEAIVIFGDASFKELSELLAYDEPLTAASEEEMLLDITNVLNGACLSGIGEQIENELAFSPPSVIGRHIPPEAVVQKDKVDWDKALMVEINYKVENRSFQCGLLLLMPKDVICVVIDALDRLLEE
ncbi:MAG: histidine kinase [Gammaproteobacteria bacterium]